MEKLTSRIRYLLLFMTVLMLCSCTVFRFPTVDPGPNVPPPPVSTVPINIGNVRNTGYMGRNCGCALGFPFERYYRSNRAVFVSCYNGEARMNLNGQDVRLQSIGTVRPIGLLRIGESVRSEYIVTNFVGRYPYYGPRRYGDYYPEYGTNGDYYPEYGTNGDYYPDYGPYGGYYFQNGPRPTGTIYPESAPIPVPTPVDILSRRLDPRSNLGGVKAYGPGYQLGDGWPYYPGFNFGDLRVNINYSVIGPCPYGYSRCGSRCVDARIEVFRSGGLATELQATGSCECI
jgi:hypothetical protein